jgi:hypothetical protein
MIPKIKLYVNPALLKSIFREFPKSFNLLGTENQTVKTFDFSMSLSYSQISFMAHFMLPAKQANSNLGFKCFKKKLLNLSYQSSFY